MSLQHKISGDIIVSTLVNVSLKVRGLVFIPLIARVLSVSAYGAFIQVQLVSRIFAKVSTLGLYKAQIKFAQELPVEDRSQLYVSLTSIVLAVSVMLGMVVFLTAESISSVFLNAPRFGVLFQLGAILIPVYAIQDMGLHYFRSQMRIKRFSILQAVRVYLNVAAVGFALLILEFELVGAVTALVASELSYALGIQLLVVRSTGVCVPRFRGLGEQLRYATPIITGEIAGQLQDRVDHLLVGFFLGALGVGIYSIAYTIAKLLRMYFLPLRITLFPEFSRLWEAGDQAACFRYVRNGEKYLVTLAIPSIVGLYLVGEQFVGLLSTPEAASHAPVLVPLIAAGVMLMGLNTLYRQLHFAAGRTVTVSMLGVAGAIVNVVLNVLLIPLMGVAGAAVATLLTFGGIFALMYRFTLREFGVRFDWIFAGRAAGASMAMLGVALLFHIEDMWLLLAICPLIYAVALYVLGGLERTEVRFMIDTLTSVVPGSR